MFFKRKKVEDSARKIDKVITWLIVWTAVASMIGLSKTSKWKNVKDNIAKEWKEVCKKWYSFFWKCLALTVKFFTKK